MIRQHDSNHLSFILTPNPYPRLLSKEDTSITKYIVWFLINLFQSFVAGLNNGLAKVYSLDTGNMIDFFISLKVAYSDKMLFLDLGPGTSDLGSLI